jgi:hypothetical protein
MPHINIDPTMPTYTDTQFAYSAVSSWHHADIEGLRHILADVEAAGRREQFVSCLLFLINTLGRLNEPKRFAAFQADQLHLSELAAQQDSP